jgi:hypothetical protein
MRIRALRHVRGQTRLFGLDFQRIWDLNCGWRIADYQPLTVGSVARDDRGLRPVQVPAIFDGNGGVNPGNHTAQRESVVEVALVSAEKFMICLRVLGDEHDHCSGGAFAITLRQTIDVRHSSNH